MAKLNHLRGWTFDEAMAFLRTIRGDVRYAGWELGLAGSVLFAGASENDLDVVVFPTTTSEVSLKKLAATLVRLGWKREVSRGAVTKAWERMGEPADGKHVEVWSHDGRRIDLFVMR